MQKALFAIAGHAAAHRPLSVGGTLRYRTRQSVRFVQDIAQPRVTGSACCYQLRTVRAGYIDSETRSVHPSTQDCFAALLFALPYGRPYCCLPKNMTNDVLNVDKFPGILSLCEQTQYSPTRSCAAGRHKAAQPFQLISYKVTLQSPDTEFTSCSHESAVNYPFDP